MDQSQQRDFELMLDRLQNPDATHQDRLHAQQFALTLQNPVDISELDEASLSQAVDANGRRRLAIAKRLGQLQHLLDNSQSAIAQVVACNSLTALVTNHWDNKTLPHVEIRNYALSFLFSQASTPTAPAYVNRAMTRLLSRVTKLGWLECEGHRAILRELTRFWDTSIEHYTMGLHLMFDLVEEMDAPATTRRGLIRKRQFLSLGLHKVFVLSLETLQKLESQAIAEPARAAMLTDAALNLAVRSLTYDFVNQAGEENEALSIAVPMSWRADFNNAAMVDLLFQLVDRFHQFAPEQAARALELLLLYINVPRSIYESLQMHTDIWCKLLEGIRNLLQTRKGFHDPGVHHMMCRLLGSLRDADHMGRTRKFKDYAEWLDLAKNFTIASFRDRQVPANSIHYLLQFWWRLSTSTRTSNGSDLLARILAAQREAAGGSPRESDDEDKGLVQTLVPEVVDAFIMSRVESVEAALAGLTDDPLDDAEMLQAQLEVLPKIGAQQYSIIGSRLVEVLDQRQRMYESALTAGSTHQVRVLEAQLAWLVRVSAAMVGGHYAMETHISIQGQRVVPQSVMGTNMQNGDELIDADVSRRMLQLVMMVERRHDPSTVASLGRADARLELALLSFMDKLKQGLLYVDSHVADDGMGQGIGSAGPGIPQLLTSIIGRRPPGIPAEVYTKIFKRIGLGDHKEVLGLLMSKVLSNLKIWADHPELVKETLVMLATMVHGASDQNAAARILLELDVTRSLFQHHTAEALPFLSHRGNERHRTTFYLTLTHLLSLNEADVDASGAFEAFLQPIIATLDSLMNTPNLRTEECRRAIIGVTRDLRGITCASNHRMYPLLFDLLYPRYLPLLTRALETWGDAPDVTNSVLKLWMELSENKDGRIKFDGAFPGGLLLFKELSASVCTYGSALLAQPDTVQPGVDAYKTRYKGIGVCLAALALALTGEYVDLGAFTLYGDKTADEVMGLAMQMALSISNQDLLAFHKVAFAFYSLSEALFRQAISIVVAMETSTVVALLQSLHHGLANALQQNLHILCARAIDRFASFLYRTRLRNTPMATRMRQHMQQVPNLVADLQLVLIKQLLTDEHTDTGILSHPLLSLILASETAFESVSSAFVARQPLSSQTAVANAFSNLMNGVQRNLETENRRAFLRNIQTMRQALKATGELVLE